MQESFARDRSGLLKTFVDSFRSDAADDGGENRYGMGTKDFEQANCLRAMLGESFTMNGTASKMQTGQDAEGENTGSRAAGKDTETENRQGVRAGLREISCNLDDMTGEDIAFAAGVSCKQARWTCSPSRSI